MKTWLILTLCTLGTATVFGGTPKADAKKAVLAAEQAFVDCDDQTRQSRFGKAAG